MICSAVRRPEGQEAGDLLQAVRWATIIVSAGGRRPDVRLCGLGRMPFDEAKIKDLASRFQVSPAGIRAYVEEFETIDTNKDGKISTEELQAGLGTFGCAVTLEEAQKMVQSADTNHDNRIDLDEFVTTVTRAVKAKDASVEKEALQAFAVFDKNNDGFISMKELRETMAKLGVPLTDKEAKEMIKLYDKNHDDRIDYKEFLQAWKNMTGRTK